MPNELQIDAFRRVVLRHLLRAVSPGEFSHFRALALDRARWDDDSPWRAAESAITARVVLVSRCVGRNSLPLRELLTCFGPGEVVGAIASVDVHYWRGAGVYACPDPAGIIDLWLTTPSYPPGW